MGIMLLTGCGEKATAEGLLQEVNENVKKVESFCGKLLMDIQMSAEDSGTAMTMEMTMDLDMEAVNDPVGYHFSGEVGLNVMNLSMEMEAYGVAQDDTFVTYSGVADSWTKNVEDIDEADIATENMLTLDAFVEGKELVLADKTEKYNGKEVYVITTSISEEEFSEAMNGVADSMSEEMLGSMDMSGLSMDVEIKIYKDTKLPAAIRMSLGEDSQAAVEVEGMEIGLTGLNYTMEFTEYDTIDQIEVPQDVLDAATDGSDYWEDTDAYVSEVEQDENGNYILKEFDDSAQISVAAPEGFEISEYADSTYLDFVPLTEDSNRYISITYYLTALEDYWTLEDVEESYASSSEMYAEADGYQDVQQTEVKTMKVGNLDVNYTILTYGFEDSMWDKQIYAWAALDDDCVVECTIYESSYVENTMIDESYIQTAFEAIQ